MDAIFILTSFCASFNLCPWFKEQSFFNEWTLHMMTVPNKTIKVFSNTWCSRYHEINIFAIMTTLVHNLYFINDSYTHPRDCLHLYFAYIIFYFITMVEGANANESTNIHCNVEHNMEHSPNSKLDCHSPTSKHKLAFIPELPLISCCIPSFPQQNTWKHVFKKAT